MTRAVPDKRNAGRCRRAEDQRGVALVVVLMLAATLAAIAAVTVESLRYAMRRSGAVEAAGQARWAAFGVEALAAHALSESWRAHPGRMSATDPWARADRASA